MFSLLVGSLLQSFACIDYFHIKWFFYVNLRQVVELLDFNYWIEV